MKLTLAQLRRIAIGPADVSNMQSVIAGLDFYGAQAGLDRPWRLAMYVAQLAHESGDFRYDHEVWGPTPAQKRYDSRTDLGNTPAADGDGKLYEGRTGIQVTGKANYAAFRDWCRKQGFNCPDFVANPEAIDTDPWEGLAPIWFWLTHGLNGPADAGNFDAVTQRINGGQNGAADRKAFYVRAALVLLGYQPTDVEGFQKSQPELAIDGDAGPVTLKALHQALTKLEAAPVVAKAAAYIQPAPIAVRDDKAGRAVMKVELRKAGSETLNATDGINKVVAIAGTGAMGVGAVNQFTDTLHAVSPLGWALIIVAILAVVYWLTHRIEVARILTGITGVNTEVPMVRPQDGAAEAPPVPDEPQPIEPAAAASGAPVAATAP